MREKLRLLVICLGLLLGIGMNAGIAENFPGLRGPVSVDEDNISVEPYQMQEGIVLHKNYRQQPPLIPHKIEKYQIDLKANQCLACHSWPQHSDFKTVAAPESHFINSQTGEKTDHIAPGRWFCNQCHVPQSNAPELVDNLFGKTEK